MDYSRDDFIGLSDPEEQQTATGGLNASDFMGLAGAINPAVSATARVTLPVIQSLHHLSRPQESLQRGAAALYRGDYGQIPSEMKKGFMLEGGDTATWGESFLSPEALEGSPAYWALKQLPSFEVGGVDIEPAEAARALGVGAAELFVDPLMAVGKLGKIPKVARGAAKAADWAAGTKLGKTFSLNPSELNWHHVNVAASQVQPEARQAQKEVTEALTSARDRAVARSRSRGEEALDWDELYEALERPDSPHAEKYADEIEDLRAIRETSRALVDESNTIARRIGAPETGVIEDDAYYRWNPRNEDVPATVRAGGGKGGTLAAGAVEAKTRRTRTLFKWVDSEGNEIMRGKANTEMIPVPGTGLGVRLVKPRTLGEARSLAEALPPNMRDRVVNVVTESGDEIFYHLGSRRIVYPKQLSKVEAQALTGEGRIFKSDPYAAHAEDLARKIDKNAFLRTADEGLKDGWLRPYDDKVGVPDGWERLDMPGMQHLVAPKPIVGRIERLGKTMFSPESVFDALEKGALAFAGSKTGQAISAFRNKWASWQLGIFPRFHAGNAAGNAFLLYMAGLPAHDVARYIGTALAAQRGWVKSVANMNPNDLIHAMEKYGAFTSWSESEKAQRLLGYAQQPGLADLADERLAQLGGVGRAAQYGTRGLRKAGEIGDIATQWGFRRFGEPIENNARLAAALWWLNRNVKKGRAPTTKELKEAAYFAQQTLFDYSDLSSFERRVLKNFAPFYSFHRKMLGRAFHDLLTKPHRLGRMERAGEMVFTTPEEQQMYDAPPYLESNAAITGIRGVGQFGDGKEGPRVALTGRFNPYSILDQLGESTGGYLWNLLMPAYKAPAEMALNKQIHSGFPIDRAVAETDVGMSDIAQGLLGPAVGAPYESREETFGLNIPNYWRYAADILPTASMVREADKLAEAIGQATGNEFLRDVSRPEYPAGQHFVRGLTGITLYEPRWRSYQEWGKVGEKRGVSTIRRLANRAREYAREKGLPETLADHYKEMADRYEERKRRERQRNSQLNSTAP